MLIDGFNDITDHIIWNEHVYHILFIPQTIFEVNTQKKSVGFQVMKTKREYHRHVIERNSLKQQERNEARALNDLTTPSRQCEADDTEVNVRSNGKYVCLQVSCLHFVLHVFEY